MLHGLLRNLNLVQDRCNQLVRSVNMLEEQCNGLISRNNILVANCNALKDESFKLKIYLFGSCFFMIVMFGIWFVWGLGLDK